MKKTWYLAALAGFLVGGGGVAVWIVGKAPSGPARIEVDRDAHNWGRVLPGADVATSFTIRNRGGLPLHFGEIKTSCGCTKPQLEQDILPPGGRVTLNVGFHAPTNLGAVRHFVAIKTDDPEKPVLELNLFAEPWLSVTTVPQAIDAGSLRPGAVLHRDVQLRSPDGKPFRIGRASSDVPGLSVDVEDAAEPLAVHRATVVYRVGDRFGQVGGSIRFVTDRADAPCVDVAFSGRTVGPISVSPASIEIEREQIGQVVHRTLVLQTDHREGTLALERVEAEPPWELVGQEVKSRRDGLMTLDLSLRFPAGDGLPSGNLDLRLSSPVASRFRIPLTIRGWTAPLPSS